MCFGLWKVCFILCQFTGRARWMADTFEYSAQYYTFKALLCIWHWHSTYREPISVVFPQIWPSCTLENAALTVVLIREVSEPWTVYLMYLHSLQVNVHLRDDTDYVDFTWIIWVLYEMEKIMSSKEGFRRQSTKSTNVKINVCTPIQMWQLGQGSNHSDKHSSKHIPAGLL